MNIQKKCPICSSRKSSLIFTVDNFPYFTAPVKKRDKRVILNKYTGNRMQGKLESRFCDNCSHIYLSTLAPEKIISALYRKYYSYPSALESNFLPERDNAFLNVFSHNIRKKLKREQKDVLEIGCYDGFVLDNLKKIGFNVTGCDPSEGALIGKKFGINIKRRFFNVDDFLRGGLSYDLIIFRHFLEHVTKPVEFLKKLPKILKPDGLIVFEIPSMKFHLNNIETSVFSFQHLQYFSRKSVKMLLKNTGLRLINLINTEENLIIVCVEEKVRCRSGKSTKQLCNRPKIDFKKRNSDLGRMIENRKAEGIALWGAGGFCVHLLETYGINDSDVRLIVDSDAKKWGMEFLKYNIPIVAPKMLKKYNHSCLIICSMYAKEIISQLKALKYSKPIINLYPRLQLHGESNDKKIKNRR